MADVFLSKNLNDLFRGKRIIFIGDSNMRALYKDCLWLKHSDSLIDNLTLRRRLEDSCMGDKLVRRSTLTKGRDFVEQRLFEKNQVELEFLFVTRCYNSDLVNMMEEIKRGDKKTPSAVIMGSCLWDLTRWGPNGPSDYKVNMRLLMELLSRCLPKETLFLWLTALPVASHITGGLIIKQIEFMQKLLNFEILAANQFTSEIVTKNGFDVLDLRYYIQSQIFRRSMDGVHYLPLPLRLMTNLILTHISISWAHTLPGNIQNTLFDSVINKASKEGSEQSQIAQLENIANKVTVVNVGEKKLKNIPFQKIKNQWTHQPAESQVKSLKNAKKRRNRKIRNQNRNFKPYNRY